MEKNITRDPPAQHTRLRAGQASVQTGDGKSMGSAGGFQEGVGDDDSGDDSGGKS